MGAVSTERVSLQSLMPALGIDQPEDLLGIFYADFDSLDDSAKELRAQVVKVLQSFERKPIHTAETAAKLISEHHLPVYTTAWTTFSLNAANERMYAPVARGGMRMLKARTKHLPRPEYLNEQYTVPEGGGYLIIWGGEPDVLNIEGVPERLAQLCASVPVRDVLFYATSEDGTGYTAWSLRGGCGQRNRNRVEFPDQVVLEIARGGWSA
jgi:hypothetical protein